MQQEEELSPDELTALLSSYMPEIPGYRVLRRIGKGGMSQVYLGVQESLDRQVAIKVMSPAALTDEISKQRFEHEARTIAKLEHPCIVGIHEVGRTRQGLLYYVLPYLAKGHLGQRDFTQDPNRVVEVLRALLSALEYAHARGIVHRDVKAENVLFDNADRPLLTDFGIALSKRDQTRITTAGLAVGSGGYMAPEQARGEVVDGRADLYSVGVLAFELLNGRLPYQAADPLALALMHAQDPVPRLPADKAHWQPFLDRAMAKSPDNRYRNAQQMLAALNQTASAQNGAAAPGSARGLTALRKHWKPAALALSGVLALLAVATLLPRSESPGASPALPVSAQPAAVARPPSPPLPAPAEPAVVTTPVDAALAQAASAPATGLMPELAPPTVTAQATVFALDYDPTLPGARELSAARRQIDRRRLSLPAGDNAMQSLRDAQALVPTDPALDALSDEVIRFYVGRIPAALARGDYDAAEADFERVAPFAKQMDRQKSKAWLELQGALVPALLARLKGDLKRQDAQGLARSKATAVALGVAPAKLEPTWSQPIRVPKPGDRVNDNGLAMVLVTVPDADRPGLAVSRTEVTRSQYAAFAAATGRPPARCRNRLVPLTLKKRSWDAPGFSQDGGHPVVCVSHADGEAFAQWLGKRNGKTYRLPTRAQWTPLATFRGSGDACRDGRLACGAEGTVAATQGPASPLGLTGLRGNVREWLQDCDGSCQRRLVAGASWRDPPARIDVTGTNDFEADTGFDDIGLRLVRDVSARELRDN